TSPDRGPGQLMALDEQPGRIAGLVARPLPHAMARIIGEQQEPALAVAGVLCAGSGGEQTEDLGVVAALEIRPGAVRQIDEVRDSPRVDREPAMHIDPAALERLG